MIAIPLLLVLILVFNRIGSALFVLIALALSRILPARFRVFATDRVLHPGIVVLIFATFVGVLLLIFRSVVGVLGGLAVAGVLVGLPWLAEWSRQRKLKKTANKSLQATAAPPSS